MSEIVKLIVTLSKGQYEALEDMKFGSIASRMIFNAVKHGTPLPKGHGRLIDADVLCDYFWDNRSKLYTCKDLQIVIDKAQPIIEADKAESEETVQVDCSCTDEEVAKSFVADVEAVKEWIDEGNREIYGG